jgi:type II secretory pathway pseudopilin PulG
MILPATSVRARRASKGTLRPAFSLLEVVIAVAIFLLSLVAIGQIISLSSDRALETQQQDQANLLCQAKLAEVLVGAEPLVAAGFQPFAQQDSEGPPWQWALECEQGDIAGLWNVKVVVQYDRIDGKRIEARLSQMILDPSLRGSTMDKPASATPSTTGGTTP